jgi:hypothetical protein
LAAAVQKVDGIRAEIDASRKRAEGFYEAREAAIRTTQVHRIATTVEIVRGLIKGERPMSIKATAKERGDILTDQISMVRIWVYPVLAFIVAFLPTLMVEIGFSTIFKPEQQQPPHRLGFLGRQMHQLYIRAGRQKILRAERMAKEASGEIAIREEALATEKVAAAKALAEKEAEVNGAREALGVAAAEHEEELKKHEEEWVAKLAGMADSLNRSIIEKDALRDLQKSEVERQVSMRQKAWSDRVTQLNQDLDGVRAASEAERAALVQEHHKKLMEVSEDCKAQVAQARRQVADAELASVENNAKLAHDLKEALHARDTAEAQWKHQADTLARQLSQVKEDAERETEKAARQFEYRLKQREQELTLAFDARLVEEKTRAEQEARRREEELERQLEARTRDVESRWSKEVRHMEESTQIRIKQREQQLQAQTEIQLGDVQKQAEEDLRRRELELERQLEGKSREAEARLRQELQQQEELFLSKSRQRDQQWQTKLDSVRVELLAQTEQEVLRREVESSDARARALRELETRLRNEIQEKDEATRAAAKEREQELVAQLAAHAEACQTALKERDEARDSAEDVARQVQDMKKKLMEASTLLSGWKNGSGKHLAGAGSGRSGS